MAPSNDVVLQRFMRALDLKALLEDPRFDSNDKRFARRDELNALINERMSRDIQAAWIDRLNAAGVPSGKVQNLAEILADPQVQDQEMVIDVDHRGHGEVRMLGFPVKLSAAPCEVLMPALASASTTRKSLGRCDSRKMRTRADQASDPVWSPWRPGLDGRSVPRPDCRAGP